MNFDMNLLVGLAGIVSTVTMIIIGVSKLPSERKKLDAESARCFAEAAKISEEAAALSAKRALVAAEEFEAYKISVQKDIEELQCEIEILKEDNEKKDKIIENLQIQLDDVQDWAERLVHQVRSLGGEPVKIKKRKDNQK